MAKHEFAMLCHHVTKQNNLSGWYASRKLDGWGFVWDGGLTRGLTGVRVPWNKQGGDSVWRESTGLWTIGRSDTDGIKPKIISAPDWFLDLLPDEVPVQGELWLPEDSSSAVQEIVSKKVPVDSEWKRVHAVIYNVKPYECWIEDGLLPEWREELELLPTWKNRSWTKRMNLIPELPEGGQVYLHKQHLCRVEEDYVDMWAEAKAKQWEGLVFVNPEAEYQSCRSYDLLKEKTAYDGEVEILGWEKGTTGKRLEEMAGAVICRVRWDEKVLTIKGGKDWMVGKEIVFKIAGGLSDSLRNPKEIEKLVGKRVRIEFSHVTIGGCPASGRLI